MGRDLRRVIPVSVRRVARRGRPGRATRPYSACYAPSVQLYFQPDGDVRACCRNMNYPLGNVAKDRLTDIWEGARRNELVSRLAVDDYSHGCQGCEWEIQTEGREGSYPEVFVDRAGHLTDDPLSAEWPRSFEFNLSNSCNLQCIQCNGDLSSSIRIHREGRPPLPKVYGEEFFEDLALFLPHLDKVQFAGGEPFMAAENFRVWDLIAEVAPDLVCQVVTNATQWNKRVEEVLEKVRFAPIFSIDGLTAETYESVRHGADHTLVMENVDRFCAYAERVGTEVEINFCLMAQNHHEFGPLLRFAEERGIRVNVSVVHYPAHCSIARLEPSEIGAIHRSLVAQEGDVLPALRINADTWSTEVARIGAWADVRDSATDHESLWGTSEAGSFGFHTWSDSLHDDHAAERALEEFAGPGAVHVLEIGDGEVIAECSPAAAAALGVDASEVIGRHVGAIQSLVEDLHGAMTDQQMLAEAQDGIDVLTTFSDVQVRTSIVPVRDSTGYYDHARLLFAKRPLTSSDERPLEGSTA